ncbi:hypothetical protein [Spirochaeta africana]|uniref:Uncharacterized protein n=1 Tax=Spirochaeta africana (strain ATCC 700263 / DSM 8902 / Z-7692) TaxID=889378 RepID=H9UKB6_SPIAZ|nr:hypothetical protein [Spirochaeta africana]AFG37959.1 hypothetical protein Spiaf_1906 [Spirochaeta africana DSM 8902]
MSDGNTQPPDTTPPADNTTEVSLDEFLDDPELIRRSQTSPDGPPGSGSTPPTATTVPAAGAPDSQSAEDEEEYLHLDIDFDDDPYELPPDIDMTAPLGRATHPDDPPPLAPRSEENSDDLGFAVEEFVSSQTSPEESTSANSKSSTPPEDAPATDDPAAPEAPARNR